MSRRMRAGTERLRFRDEVSIPTLSWGAIAAGAIAALGAGLALHAVGLAIASGLEVHPMFEGGYAVFTLTSAMYLGGVVTGRSLGPGASRGCGALNGLLLAALVIAGGAAVIGALGLDVLDEVARLAAPSGVLEVASALTIGGAVLAVATVFAMIGGAAGITRLPEDLSEPIRRRAPSPLPSELTRSRLNPRRAR